MRSGDGGEAPRGAGARSSAHNKPHEKAERHPQAAASFRWRD